MILFRVGCAIVWAVIWGLAGMPWDGTADTLNPRGLVWTFSPESKRQLLDAFLNFIFYIPLGALLASNGVSAARAVGAALLLSATTELLQLFSVTRVAAFLDLVLNTAGAWLGARIATGTRETQQA